MVSLMYSDFLRWKYVFGIQTHGTGAKKRYCTCILREQDLSAHSLLGKVTEKIYEASQGQSSRAPGTVCLGASSPGIQQGAEPCADDGGGRKPEKVKSSCEGCERSRDLTLWLKMVVIKEVDKSCLKSVLLWNDSSTSGANTGVVLRWRFEYW